MPPTPIDEAAEYDLTASKVAAAFHVNPKTVARWAESGLIPYRRTLGGHRRYRTTDVERLLAAKGIGA